MEVINTLCAADQTFIGWVTMVVPCWRTYVIWLETLSSICVCVYFSPLMERIFRNLW
jgi:hypothetical protein